MGNTRCDVILCVQSHALFTQCSQGAHAAVIHRFRGVGVKEDMAYIIMTGYKAGVNFERRCELMKLCGNQGNVDAVLQ